MRVRDDDRAVVRGDAQFALENNADAVAFATLNFAMNRGLVNSIKSKGNFTVKRGGVVGTSQEPKR